MKTAMLAVALMFAFTSAIQFENGGTAEGGPAAAPAGQPDAKLVRKYAIVVSAATNADAGWKEVVECLKRKHQGQVFEYKQKPEEVRQQLAEARPYYIAFVAKPTEAPRSYVRYVHQFTRALDDDPYTDALWGIVTGYDAKDALKVAQMAAIRAKFRAGMGNPTNWVQAGWGYNENVSGVRWNKEKGKPQVETKDNPADSTRELANLLNDNMVDLFWASGRATETSWELGFGAENGQFQSVDGQLVGVSKAGERTPIKSTNPKIVCPSGNGRIGHISDPKNCLALSLIRNGAYQLVGYTVPNQYGWYNGLHFWVCELQGQFTFAESFFLHHQLLLANLATGRAQDEAVGAHRHDRDDFVFYGDPAVDARIEKCTDPAIEITLKIEPADDPAWLKVTLTGKLGKKTQIGRLQAAVASVLPYQLQNFKPLGTNADAAVAADNFVLFYPPAGDHEAGTTWQATFLAQRIPEGEPIKLAPFNPDPGDPAEDDHDTWLDDDWRDE